MSFSFKVFITWLFLTGSVYVYAAKPPPSIVKTNYVTITNKVFLTNEVYGFVNLNNETNIAKVFSFPLFLQTNNGTQVRVEFYEIAADGINILHSTNLNYSLSNSLFLDSAFGPCE
jgi:hypothetical protein